MVKKNATVITLSQPIDIRYKWVKRPFCKRKIVETTLSEQKRLKKAIVMIYPDNRFYDDLNEYNSIEAKTTEYIPYSPDTPINLVYRYKKNLFGKRKQISTNSQEQIKLKKVLLKIFPDSKFYDGLSDKNSILMEGHKSFLELQLKGPNYLPYSIDDVDYLFDDNDNNNSDDDFDFDFDD